MSSATENLRFALKVQSLPLFTKRTCTERGLNLLFLGREENYDHDRYRLPAGRTKSKHNHGARTLTQGLLLQCSREAQ